MLKSKQLSHSGVTLFMPRQSEEAKGERFPQAVRIVLHQQQSQKTRTIPSVPHPGSRAVLSLLGWRRISLRVEET